MTCKTAIHRLAPNAIPLKGVAFFMPEPLLNILIRNKYRPELFTRCIESVLNQTYKNVRILIACDTDEAFEQAMQYSIGAFMVTPFKTSSYYWNLYCNDLKAFVHDGWFFYLDNDDYLASETALEELVKHLDTPGAVITQFLRNGRPKPSDALMKLKIVEKGRIGGGCMVLHSSYKNVADWDDQPAADFRWIHKIVSVVPTKFISLVLQVAGNNGLHGV